MNHSINPDSPAGAAFSQFCEGALDITALDLNQRDELASCAYYWLSIPAIADPRDPADSTLPSYLRAFIVALEA